LGEHSLESIPPFGRRHKLAGNYPPDECGLHSGILSSAEELLLPSAVNLLPAGSVNVASSGAAAFELNSPADCFISSVDVVSPVVVVSLCEVYCLMSHLYTLTLLCSSG
jgi:hypothetical protein